MGQRHVLANVNRVLRAQTATIATAIVAYVDLERGTMTFASAGHLAPLVASSDGSATLLAVLGAAAKLGTAISAHDVFERVLARKMASDDIAVVVMRWKSSSLGAAPKESLTKHRRFNRVTPGAHNRVDTSSCSFSAGTRSARKISLRPRS